MRDCFGKVQRFEVGKLVIAYDNLENLLTKNKSYEIKETGLLKGGFVSLVADNGEERAFRSSRFMYHPYDIQIPAAEKVTQIDELLKEIAYSWDYSDHRTLHRAKDGLFHVNKLTIGPYWTEYKGDYQIIEPELYMTLCDIYDIILARRKAETSKTVSDLTKGIP